MRALLAILFAASLGAQDLKRVEPQGYVSDFANVVSPASRSAINGYLKSLEERTGAQVAIVTVATLKGESIEDAAIDLYRRWGVGRKERNEGALFLFAIQDRKSRLEVGYGLEPILTDGTSGDILRAMRPALRERKYGEAFQEAARNLGDRNSAAKNVAPPDGLPQPVQKPNPLEGIPVDKIFGYTMLGLFVVVFLWQAYSMRGGWRRGGRGGGSGFYIPTSGGFGGSSSGGGSSWGGFGGGDAGGGGASSDW